jgi:hypothetical protein
LERVFEKTHVDEHPRESLVGAIQIRIQTQRTAVFLNRSFVRVTIRGSPQQVAAGDVGFGEIGVERQRSFGGRIGLLLQLTRLLGDHEVRSADVGRGQHGVEGRETGIESDRAFQERDGLPAVRIGGACAEVTSAQQRLVRLGVDRA